MSGSIAVVITVFNRRHFLEKALLALHSQTQRVDELIISDDGSGEDILSIVRDFAGQVSYPVKYIYQDNLGFRLAKCRNNAIREAKSDFIIFIDQDVVYTAGYLKTFADNRRTGQFLVAYPVRLDSGQSDRLTDDQIRRADYEDLVTAAQLRKVRKQYFKDKLEYWLRTFVTPATPKPKLRGGVCGICRSDLLKVDGYDENYQGWGNEDDDLSRRLYRAGIRGRNPFYNEYPLHLYHEPFHVNGRRVNREFYSRRIKEIAAGQTRAVNGLSKPKGEDHIRVKIFNQ